MDVSNASPSPAIRGECSGRQCTPLGDIQYLNEWFRCVFRGDAGNNLSHCYLKRRREGELDAPRPTDNRLELAGVSASDDRLSALCCSPMGTAGIPPVSWARLDDIGGRSVPGRALCDVESNACTPTAKSNQGQTTAIRTGKETQYTKPQMFPCPRLRRSLGFS